MEDGWDLEEVEQEFEDFFNLHGSEIVNEDHKDQAKFKAELDQAARFYNKGIASGKVKNMDGWQTEEARFQKLYDVAMVAAHQNELKNNRNGSGYGIQAGHANQQGLRGEASGAFLATSSLAF